MNLGVYAMQHAANNNESDPVTEMSIVDTFTKLIFGEEADYCDRELLIIRAFRLVDVNVLRDSHADMGEYLRNLGIREMIHLVARLREYIREDSEILASAAQSAEGVAQSRSSRQSRPL
jgi:hypothetical protein